MSLAASVKDLTVCGHSHGIVEAISANELRPRSTSFGTSLAASAPSASSST